MHDIRHRQAAREILLNIDRINGEADLAGHRDGCGYDAWVSMVADIIAANMGVPQPRSWHREWRPVSPTPTAEER